MPRLAVFIDGFNIYHSIDEDPTLRPAKWLNYATFASQFLQSSKDTLDHVLWFTSYAFWDPQKETRHKSLVKANLEKGVRVVFGKFKIQQRQCRLCHRMVDSPVEKMTDINIAASLFELACHDAYDKALIISGDSDLVPAIETVRSCYPKKSVGVAFPLGRFSVELQRVASFSLWIKRKHLLRAQLEDQLTLADGSTVTRPLSWK